MYPNQQNNKNQPIAPDNNQNSVGPTPNPYPVTPSPRPQTPPAPPYAPSQLANGQDHNEPVQKPNKKKFIIIGAGALVVVLLLIVVAVVSLSGSSNKSSNSQIPDTTNAKTETAPGLVPLTSVTIEQINASIGFDFSTINDVKDFYPEKLDDKTLGL